MIGRGLSEYCYLEIIIGVFLIVESQNTLKELIRNLMALYFFCFQFFIFITINPRQYS